MEPGSHQSDRDQRAAVPTSDHKGRQDHRQRQGPQRRVSRPDLRAGHAGPLQPDGGWLMATFAEATRRTITATHDVLVKVAKREHAKVMATSPRPIGFTRFVDGAKGRAEETVKPNGVILYQYPRLDIVAKFAMETLYRLSPLGLPAGGH